MRRSNRYRSPRIGAAGGLRNASDLQRDHLGRPAAYRNTRPAAAGARARVPAPISAVSGGHGRRLWPVCCGRARIGRPGGGPAWSSRCPRAGVRSLAKFVENTVSEWGIDLILIYCISLTLFGSCGNRNL